ncbi:hypothetical protein HHI36_006228 [Cryptolaemus montrouzieri]|uniref:Uncharacterized protein n=1 Tax=Cryptolaemus montrouzieri TaxID=559131 RepID=A0ABD2NWI8_9CUCU
MVCRTAYHLVEYGGRHNCCGRNNKQVAGKLRWTEFKKRYNLSLRVPENLAAYRASMANLEIVEDFFEKLDSLVTRLVIKDMPDRNESKLRYQTN